MPILLGKFLLNLDFRQNERIFGLYLTRKAFVSSRVIQAQGKFDSNMTRRAFLSSRVIQAQGKFDSNMLVKNLESLVSKTKISENP